MLGKLLKYDFSDTKLLLTAYCLSIGSSLISLLFFKCGAFASDNGFIVILSGAQFLFTILTVFGVLVASVVMTVVNFGKHTVGAQGQMMFTLPVSIDQFLASKIISAFAIMVGSWVYLAAWMAGVFVSTGVLREVMMILSPMFSVSFFVITIVGILSSIMMYYTAIALSGRFSPNRVLGSVVAYLCISFAVQVITTIVFVLSGWTLASTVSFVIINNDPMIIFDIISIIVSVLYGIMILGGYFVTRREFSKKINLP